ncbi:iron ABC transporter permease [Dehalococcoides mccartyi CG4]|uniref:FecCD family ABC transporter permease n=1 Tax=Dehalococcoides mccartyi TaxID=61435 RepID=UPI0004E04518|nr:iron ABC transporter permease [Dehalococcoides mccartyi]AII59734.1 iron ABC transporter permease [Dehalococcoides mccartyi CG4]
MEENRTNQFHLYNAFLRRKRLVFLIAAVATVVAALFAVGAGSLHITLPDVVKTLFGNGSDLSQMVIFNIRLPRVVAAIAVGAILAVSGAVMQCVLRNPLASASTLGVSHGAAFGAAVGIIVFGGGVVNSDSAATAVSINNPYIVTLCAFICGSLSTFVVILLSQLKKDLGPGGLILAGVALSSLFTGGTTLLQYFADETKISSVVFWTFGNMGAASWTEILILAIVFAASITYFLLNRWNYNAMEGGTDTAKSLGVNTRAVMLISMCICTLTAAVAVSFVGIISFVGLVAPHIMRRFMGNDYRYLIPCSAAAGALLLVLADTFGRLVIAPVILPIGAITSFLGAPLFLFLLFRGFKSND